MSYRPKALGLGFLGFVTLARETFLVDPDGGAAALAFLGAIVTL